jgi:hypothetical protein
VDWNRIQERLSCEHSAKSDGACHAFAPGLARFGLIHFDRAGPGPGCGSRCAACRAIDDKATTWKLDYANLRTRLLANGQILEWQ